MSETLGTWIDGISGNVVPADDRGLQYGDGLFETILVRANRPRFLDAHLTRMSQGLVKLGIQFEAVDALRADIATACAQAPGLAILKIVITRGSARRRGYAPSGTESARRIVSLWRTSMPEQTETGVDLRVARLRVPEYSPLAGIKHLNRLENVVAAAEQPDAAFESLLLDTSGQVVSGTMSNVFIVKSATLLTPPTDRAGVAGVMRGIVMREAERLRHPVKQQVLTLDELLAADEVFITNARIGVVPVRNVGEHVFGMNPISLQLRAHIESLDA